MTWRLHHEWARGPVIIDIALATCPHCDTLRVSPTIAGQPHYIRRRAEESERVSTREPPCLAPQDSFKAPW